MCDPRDRKEGYLDRSHDSVFRDPVRPSLVLSIIMSGFLASRSDCVLVGLFACFSAFLLIFFLRVFYSARLFVFLVARLIEVLEEVRGSRNSWETILCIRVYSDIARSGRLQMWLRDMASSVSLSAVAGSFADKLQMYFLAFRFQPGPAECGVSVQPCLHVNVTGIRDVLDFTVLVYP